MNFTNAKYLKLRQAGNDTYNKILTPILIDDEEVIATYVTVRDGVIFTTHRIIAINIEGVTGVKKEITTLPYTRIQAFSIETAGIFDLDSVVTLWFSGLGKVTFEFLGNSNIRPICRLISEGALSIPYA